MAPTTDTAAATGTAATNGTAAEDRPCRVERAISDAMDMVRAFSERDPHDGDAENPWKNPQAMLEQLDRAREGIEEAREQVSSKEGSETTATKEPSVDQNDFRAAYMDMVTHAFSDVLEEMRTNGDEDLDVDILVDCLQSGMDLMSGEEVEHFMMDDDDILEDGSLTPHEERRLEVGLPTQAVN